MNLNGINGLVGLLAVALSATGASAGGSSAVGHGGEPAVVVELFTSQGCSSCPPADRLLTRLGSERDDVIPLAFHVDYWNYIGWRDPFSSAEWSRRQAAYAERLGGNLYTPQAVVGGFLDALGSSKSRIETAIAAVRERPAARLTLALDRDGDAVRVAVEVERPSALHGRELELMVALTESGIVTAVGRGENGGRELRNDYVVRALRRLGNSSGGEAGERFIGEIPVLSDGSTGSFAVAAFLQDPSTLEIVGAAAQAL